MSTVLPLHQELYDLVERWLFPEVRSGFWPSPLRVTGIIKPGPLALAEGSTARQVRAEFLNSAEDMLEAVQSAGWQMARHAPDMTLRFTGQLRPAMLFLDETLAKAAEQYGISLEVGFEVVRASADTVTG